jgi:hypothetical protein
VRTMSLNLSNYEQADYVDAPALPAAPIEPDTSVFARAIVFGLVGALLGAVIYALFVGITGISIGYLAILVAYMVAKAMTMGSHERGGRKYQVTALVLTYLALAASHSMLVWWFVQKDGPVPFTLRLVVVLAKYGLIFPVTALESSPGSGLIGLIILFVGLRAAWRMTSGEPGASHHPFSR